MNSETSTRVKWNFTIESNVERFYDVLLPSISEILSVDLCVSPFCSNSEHRQVLNTLWSKLIERINIAGENVFGDCRNHARSVPGWNEYVREHYNASRIAFLEWRNAGSPRQGPIADTMRRKRANFKLILRQTKRREEEIKAENIARKYNSKNSVALWRELNSIRPEKNILPMRIDEAAGEEDIAQKWRLKYSEVLNSVDDDAEKEALQLELGNAQNSSYEHVSPEEVYLVSSELDNGKSPGKDGVPAEFFKYAPVCILEFVARFFNSVMCHGFLPSTISDVLLIPIPKNKLGDISNSSNYRPIAIATAVSKIFEKLLLNRMCSAVDSSDHQFGFKKSHSTDLCIVALKEVIGYYRKLNTPLFICFVDIKSAFDRVSCHRLFRKLVLFVLQL